MADKSFDAVEQAFCVFGDDDDSGTDDESTVGMKPRTVAPVTQRRLTVAISLTERETHQFTPSNIAAASACLRTHGMVILDGVFDVDAMAKLGEAALSDLEWAIAAATVRKNELKASSGNKSSPTHDQMIYKELVGREEGRFEVRGGHALAEALAAESSGKDGRPGKVLLPLQTHPGILAILRVACAAPGFALNASEVTKQHFACCVDLQDMQAAQHFIFQISPSFFD
jgi:hypothetical protein